MPRPQFSIQTLLWLTLVVAAFSGAMRAPAGDRLNFAIGAFIFVASITGGIWLLFSGKSAKAILFGLVACALLAMVGFTVFLPAIQQAR